MWGLDTTTAAAVVPILVSTAFVSQLVGGVVGDMWDKRALVPFLALMQGASLIVLALAESFVMAAVFAVIWGIGFRCAYADLTCDARRVFRTGGTLGRYSLCRASRCR